VRAIVLRRRHWVTGVAKGSVNGVGTVAVNGEAVGVEVVVAAAVAAWVRLPRS
jgi:hypothetical protein